MKYSSEFLLILILLTIPVSILLFYTIYIADVKSTSSFQSYKKSINRPVTLADNPSFDVCKSHWCPQSRQKSRPVLQATRISCCIMRR